LRKPWSIFAFPISESSKKICGASWVPWATFKHIKKGGIFFFFGGIFLGGIFFVKKSTFDPGNGL
jgi:hypothetical protein